MLTIFVVRDQVLEQIQKVTDKFVKKVDETVSAKEKDIMTL